MDYYVEYNQDANRVVTGCSSVSHAMKNLEDELKTHNLEVFSVQKVVSVLII